MNIWMIVWSYINIFFHNIINMVDKMAAWSDAVAPLSLCVGYFIWCLIILILILSIKMNGSKSVTMWLWSDIEV